LVFCLLSFLHLPLPPVRFLGQARVGCENTLARLEQCQRKSLEPLGKMPELTTVGETKLLGAV
jgi:hypothetical protein